MKPLGKPPKSILICNIRLIGDVVLTTPLVALLKQQYPNARIDFLVNSGTGEFLEKDPRITKVLYSDKWRDGSGGLFNGYLGKILGKYDLAICMNPSDRGTIATILAGCSCRVGFYEARNPFGAFWRKALLTHPLLYDDKQHVVLSCAWIADTLGLPVTQLEVKVFWDSADTEAVYKLLMKNKQEYFVVHPFARWRYKYWDIERFAAVSDYIFTQYGLMPVWTSSPDPEETKLLISAAELCKIHPLLIPGQLTLNQMACLLQGASLYLGLDTAITHIAASTGVPTIALYGPTEIWRWHPWDNTMSLNNTLQSGYRGDYRSSTIIALQAPCDYYPCVRPSCYGEDSKIPCLMALSIDKVCIEVDQILSPVSSVWI